MIQKAIGDSNSPVLVRSIRPWTMTAQVAEKFGDESGHVFLAGDAAHRFPPAGGFGEPVFEPPVCGFVSYLLVAVPI